MNATKRKPIREKMLFQNKQTDTHTHTHSMKK